MYKGIKLHKVNNRNPFWENLTIETRKKNIIVGTAADVIVNRETGETTGHTAFVKHLKIDKSKFVKVFTNEVSNFFDLSRAGMRVFCYVLSIAKPNIDQIVFDLKDCQEFTAYKSKATVFKGMSELLENRFMARSPKHYIFFINPSIFFNGDRQVSFVKSYQMKDSNAEMQKAIDESRSDMPED